MGVSGKIHAPAVCPRRNSPGAHWIRELVGPRSGLEILLPLPGIAPRFVQPGAFSVYRVGIPLHTECCQLHKKAACPNLYIHYIYTVYIKHTVFCEITSSLLPKTMISNAHIHLVSSPYGPHRWYCTTVTVRNHMYGHTQHTVFVTAFKKYRIWNTKYVFYTL
jgi:hypothetical protein